MSVSGGKSCGCFGFPQPKKIKKNQNQNSLSKMKHNEIYHVETNASLPIFVPIFPLNHFPHSCFCFPEGEAFNY